MNVQEDFWRRIYEEWLPAFCHARDYDPAGFRPEAKKLHESDLRDFLRAINHKVVAVDADNNFRASRSNVAEHIFWEGSSRISPRPISLWIEPIITVAAIARLHLDYDWPVTALGMQSVDWAFDFMAYQPNDLDHEFIAGEVKATSRELDRLQANLRNCCIAGDHDCLGAKPDQRNAHKKWLGLMRSRAPLFWAVGPASESRVFDVRYNGNSISLTAVSIEKLTFSPNNE